MTEPGSAPEAGRSPRPSACATCGVLIPDDLGERLTWSSGVENGRETWTCPRCTRENVRSIEGKLDSAWW